MNKNLLKILVVISALAILVFIKMFLRGTFVSGLLIGLCGYVGMKLWMIIGKKNQKLDERDLLIMGKTGRFLSTAVALYLIVMLVLVEKNIINIDALTTLEITCYYLTAMLLGSYAYNLFKN